jgi:hypothetical protein
MKARLSLSDYLARESRAELCPTERISSSGLEPVSTSSRGNLWLPIDLTASGGGKPYIDRITRRKRRSRRPLSSHLRPNPELPISSGFIENQLICLSPQISPHSVTHVLLHYRSIVFKSDQNPQDNDRLTLGIPGLCHLLCTDSELLDETSAVSICLHSLHVIVETPGWTTLFSFLFRLNLPLAKPFLSLA